jgi:hypothetical protein
VCDTGSGPRVFAAPDDGCVFAVDARGCGARTCAALGFGRDRHSGPLGTRGQRRSVYVLDDAGDRFALGAADRAT